MYRKFTDKIQVLDSKVSSTIVQLYQNLEHIKKYNYTAIKFSNKVEYIKN